MNKIKGFKPAQKCLKTPAGDRAYYNISAITQEGLPSPERLPFCIKFLLENLLRHYDNHQITVDTLRQTAAGKDDPASSGEIAFHPARVILQDFTGVPCLVDLAAMRAAVHRLGKDHKKINPKIPCHLIIDHSVQVDAFGNDQAFATNIQKEFERNRERYIFLKWGQKAFDNFAVVPPATGIIHQINLEYLAQGVLTQTTEDGILVFPDSLIGTDSHTTMINCLSIVGWGVGGIEAEAVMLGESISMLLPQVIGFKLDGQLPESVTATDLVLTITEILRKKGVVGKFIEFFGTGISSLTLPERAVLSNMTPEFGATMGFFPVDDQTLDYYRLTGRSPQTLDLIDRYMKAQGMFYTSAAIQPDYSEVMSLDLSTIKKCLAGPRRPQDRIPIESMRTTFTDTLKKPVDQGGWGIQAVKMRAVDLADGTHVGHGSVVIASITSCTNTSNPGLMIGAGLLARKAVERGLKIPAFVKTSFAPGSQAVGEYLKKAGLLDALDALGFNIVGYGCMTCIGNSGPLKPDAAEAIVNNGLIAASVLSGNRNFEGRIHALVKANYLASPLLVIAYALAGSVNLDLMKEPLGNDSKGQPVYLEDIWPSADEINSVIRQTVGATTFTERYSNVYEGDSNWKAIQAPDSELFEWEKSSTYIQEPPFFDDLRVQPDAIRPINGARVLILAGDSVTTDHISPAGAIPLDSPAGKYLTKQGVKNQDFNSYGSRRGNDRVMTRGTFANIRMRNQLTPGKEGSWTVYFPKEKDTDIYSAAQMYRKDNIPLIILAGKEYGTGSSRDWAAKGTALLGIKIVLAESFERIHRSNLIGMGVLPLQFITKDSVEKLGLKGNETFDFTELNDNIKPGQEISVKAKSPDGALKKFKAVCRLDTPVEVDYYRHGGILPYVLRKLTR